MKYAPGAERILVISSGGQTLSLSQTAPKKVHWISLSGDLGHIGDLIGGTKTNKFAGHTPTICANAMLAYINECDFVAVEQDVLIFGDVVSAMYEEAGDRGIMIGKSGVMPCANALMLIKHHMIPDYVSFIMGGPSDGDKDNLAEHQMARWAYRDPDRVGFYGFGYDRNRPFHMEDKVWYIQKTTPSELIQLRNAGLLHFDNMPDVKVFSNT